MAVDGFGLSDFQNKKKNKAEAKEVATAVGLISIKEDKHNCIFCGQNHDSTSCGKARKMQYDERLQVVKGKNACYHCLKIGHSFKFCRYKEKCAWCNKKHVLLMCRSRTPNVSQGKDQIEKTNETQQQSNLASAHLTCEVFLQTLHIKLFNQDKERVVRAVFDTGSHRSYVLDCYAKKLDFQIIVEQEVVHMLFGGAKSKPRMHKGYKISVKSLDNSYSCNFVALDQDVICRNVPSVKKGPWIQELQQQGIKLTDVDNRDEPIVVLIGADICGKLITGRKKELKCGVIAFETLLGWTLLRKTNVQSTRREDSTLMVVSMYAQDANIANLWELDTLGITDPISKKTKDIFLIEVKERFQQTIKVNEEGRYEISLPWRYDHLPLADNKNDAKRRLESTTRKLQKQGLYDDYQSIFDEWLAEGIIERVPDEEIRQEGYYLPHRHVIKENSTTRIRPGFDASAVGTNGLSLNQCLETGPNLIGLIPNILLGFRRRRIALISNIRRAFLQISVSPEDKNVLRFLWWKKMFPEQIEVYRHRRVVFGVSSSPFLLGGITGRMNFSSKERSSPLIGELFDWRSVHVTRACNCVL
ncbi:PREDICTED: uncharacterized protein LOC108779953 [Cyphomyrmex costatus]|uniref:uncharacterized protein LOC108779953 n=1 Tax=Cyphomyrmex costatus TaxID=456900 RepID=UPI0008523759|nr:PREDICTED: uncharacterized protein LOC108779953 [Cyphomyrmex costatus]